ncbi:hypothetical protein EVAR_97841_1 [Eumeta japonica]|uniref:Uncharacterized protein n=1 Tax=Eumeta variegata TaxID=151549 RepID=A0A4C1WXK3_EUMVA|nr:hypothetical protein EVAR_97841_1 [Eumeta japonica]
MSADLYERQDNRLPKSGSVTSYISLKRLLSHKVHFAPNGPQTEEAQNMQSQITPYNYKRRAMLAQFAFARQMLGANSGHWRFEWWMKWCFVGTAINFYTPKQTERQAIADLVLRLSLYIPTSGRYADGLGQANYSPKLHGNSLRNPD